jgi:hypothetical protein
MDSSADSPSPQNDKTALSASISAGGAPAAQVNLEQLACAVLALMKHELRLERERLGQFASWSW